MTPSSWFDDIYTGIPEIDREHRTIAATMDHARRLITQDADADLVAPLIQRAHSLFEHHIASEERAFAAIAAGLPVVLVRDHDALHTEVLSGLTAALRRVAAEDDRAGWIAALDAAAGALREDLLTFDSRLAQRLHEGESPADP